MGIRRETIDDLLVKKGVAPSLLAEAHAQATKAGDDVLKGILESGVIDDRMLVSALSEATGIPILHEIPVDDLDPTLVQDLSMGLAREQGFLPLWIKGGVLHVAISSPKALSNADDMRVLHKLPVQTWLVGPTKLRDVSNLAYDKAARTAHAVMEEIKDETKQEEVGDLNLDADLVDDPNQAPIIRFVNSLLTQSIKDRASDIHIEPFEKELSVRFRIDGVLYEIVKPPARLQASIIARVKIMAQLNIAEKRIPQDGRIRTRMAGREIDIRVSTLPVRHGERVVMRLLEKGTVFNLEQVGMGPADMAHFRKLIQLPHGIILVCGPTGSGKTTTLYSALSEINSPDLNILTIEDPIEYELRGIGQTQVNPKIDLTFASALRAHLRQDPDVILVGEIRDKETADNAVQASLTGHLVFSTIHTNDAPTTFTRLTDMGVEPFLVASSLIAVLAQRLVRRLCNECKAPYTPSDEELADVGLSREQANRGTIFRSVGCRECLNKGYRGRTGIYELLLIDDDIRALVTGNANSNIIKRKAVEHGMRTLRDDGVRKTLEGVTSLDEVMRVTQEDVIEGFRMAVFEYKGFDAKGAAAIGIVDADSPKGARTKLRRQGVFATDVYEQKGGGAATRGAGLNVSIDFKKYFERVSSQDISTMTQQLSTLVGAGIPMVEALNALIEQTENGKLKLVLTDVREKVNEGIPLARSLKEHPRIFDELYTSMVAAGEQSGALEIVLQRLSEFTDAMVRLKGKVLSAMLYPVMMGAVSIAVLIGMFIFVIPRVKSIFDSFGATLPLATRITLGVSDFFVNYWYLVILFIVTSAYGFRRWVRTPEGRFKWHKFLLHAPIIGKVNQLVAVSRFCRTLSTLLVSGVPILTAMTIVKDVVQNDVLAKAIGDAGTNIAEGQSIARPLREAEEFPPLVTHMIAIGERTGELETMLGRVADAYDQQTEIRLEALTSLLGPLLIMCLGGLVGLMAVTILVPMLNISSIVR